MHFRFRPALLTLMSVCAVSQLNAQGKEPWPGLDAYVEAALKTWKTPGLGLAVIRNDSVIYARGYGIRDLGKPDKVDERTIFAIGSASKAFTAASVAMLVDEKKVSLDANPALYLPGFQLYDPYATREVTVRDLLSHRSGLARGELAWYGSGNDRDEIVRRVRFLAPSWSFRSRYGYQNIMYIAAGQVVAKTSGRSWDDFVRERIFSPLGMSSSSTSVRGIAGQPNVAAPHAGVNDTMRAIPWRDIDNAGPAGSINSSALEMAQWVRLQLCRGSYGGKQLISARMVDEMHQAHTVIRSDSADRANNPESHLRAYGLGWFLQDYRGRLAVHHGGNVDGFTALVGMMPEERFGVVLLSNQNGSGLPTALMFRLFDLQLKAPLKDWATESYARTQAQIARGREAQQKAAAERVANTKPSLPLSAYAGTYADSLYGKLSIREENGALQLSFGPTWKAKLEHYHFDSFRARLDTPVLPPVPVTFRIGANGKVESVVLDMAGVAEFRRVPEQRTAGR